MAKTLIVPKSRLFLIVMSTEDMAHLNCICEAKTKNYYEVVEACFHAGLVTLTNHTKCHKPKGKSNGKEKETNQRHCPECGQFRSPGENENIPTG